jgi:hypothetical protein
MCLDFFGRGLETSPFNMYIYINHKKYYYGLGLKHVHGTCTWVNLKIGGGAKIVFEWSKTKNLPPSHGTPHFETNPHVSQTKFWMKCFNVKCFLFHVCFVIVHVFVCSMLGKRLFQTHLYCLCVFGFTIVAFPSNLRKHGTNYMWYCLVQTCFSAK